MSQAFFSFIFESEEGIEPSTHNEERPRGLESNQSRQTLILQYTKKKPYKSSVFFNFLKIFGNPQMEYTLIRAIYPR